MRTTARSVERRDVFRGSMHGERTSMKAKSKDVPAGQTQRSLNGNRKPIMKNKAPMLAYATALLLLLAAPAIAQEVKAGDLVITQAWSRATPSGAKIAGGYLPIENKGSAPDRLID